MSELVIDLPRALRDEEYRVEISEQLEGYGVSSLRNDAAAEIDRLRVMAYQPASRHLERCNCIQCVPF